MDRLLEISNLKAPYLAHIPASEARFYPLYAKCCELGIPVFITMAPPPQVPGAILDYANPCDVDRVARDFPELTLIMSHGGYPFVHEAIYACQRNANVYMDISEYERSPMVETYVKAMNGPIRKKVVFASAHPFIELSDALEAYRDFLVRHCDGLAETVRRPDVAVLRVVLEPLRRPVEVARLRQVPEDVVLERRPAARRVRHGRPIPGTVSAISARVLASTTCRATPPSCIVVRFLREISCCIFSHRRLADQAG